MSDSHASLSIQTEITTDGSAVPRTWKVKTTSALAGTALDGSRLVFRPGRYVMAQRPDGCYDLRVPDAHVVYAASEISNLLERGQLLIEGSWPGTR